jgi:hypothetical protein
MTPCLDRPLFLPPLGCVQVLSVTSAVVDVLEQIIETNATLNELHHCEGAMIKKSFAVVPLGSQTRGW